MKVEQFRDPYLGIPWGELGARVLTTGNQVRVTLGYPARGRVKALATELAAFLGVAHLDLDVQFMAPAGRGFGNVKHVVAVASGKGGVG
ncbi:MAG: MRP family ATP-binding protein, partial [Gammaproteobacteria bacterium]